MSAAGAFPFPGLPAWITLDAMTTEATAAGLLEALAARSAALPDALLRPLCETRRGRQALLDVICEY